MKALKLFLLAHMILGPLAVFIIADDAAHPERWQEELYRNPAFSIPFCIVGDCFIGCVFIHLWLQERRVAKGMWLLREAIRLQAQGKYAAAEAAYRKGRKLTGLDRN